MSNYYILRDNLNRGLEYYDNCFDLDKAMKSNEDYLVAETKSINSDGIEVFSYSFKSNSDDRFEPQLTIKGWTCRLKLQLWEEGQNLIFIFKDPRNVEREYTTREKYMGAMQGVNRLYKFSFYSNWNHYDLSQEVENQTQKVVKLEAKVKELQLKLDSIYENKTDLRKLAQLLYLEN